MIGAAREKKVPNSPLQEPIPVHPGYGAGGKVHPWPVPHLGRPLLLRWRTTLITECEGPPKRARQINGLVNEWYLEDLSENIRMVFDLKRRQGQYIGAFPIYGYQKDRKTTII
jgi:hypothetical protein